MAYILTNISQGKRNSERVNLYLNGDFWLALSKNNLIELKLSKGKEISAAEKVQIENVAVKSNCLDKALNYINIHPRSCSEVRDYLVYRKEIAVEEAESVIALLIAEERLSDEKFVEWYTNYKLNSGVNGSNKIKMELMQKGVNLKTITSVFEKIFAADDVKTEQTLKIEEFALKASRSIKAKDAYDFKSKLTQRLMSRGFKYNEIKEVVKNINFGGKDASV